MKNGEEKKTHPDYRFCFLVGGAQSGEGGGGALSVSGLAADWQPAVRRRQQPHAFSLRFTWHLSPCSQLYLFSLSTDWATNPRSPSQQRLWFSR